MAIFWSKTYSIIPTTLFLLTEEKAVQQILTLVITSLIVSLDSFVAGFSVSLNKRQNITLPAVVALVTLIMCLITTFIGKALQGIFDEYVDIFSAVILAALAVTSLLKTDDNNISMQSLSLCECVAVGVAVGLDASVANLSLAVAGYGVIAPIVFAVTHYFTVLMGQRLAGKLVVPNTNVFSAVILFALAVIKFL